MTTSIPDHPAIDAVMSTAASVLGMEIVFLGGLTEDTFTFEKVKAQAEWPGVEEGSSAAREGSLCHRLLGGAPSRTSDAANDPAYADAEKRTELGITSYVGVPIRDGSGQVVATLCGIDRGRVEVSDETLEVLQSLADVIAAHLGPLITEGLVIRRAPEGGWTVGEHHAGDLTSAMVLADLLASEINPGSRPPEVRRPARRGRPAAHVGEAARARPGRPRRRRAGDRRAHRAPAQLAAAGLRAAAQGRALARPQGARPVPRDRHVGERPRSAAAAGARRPPLSASGPSPRSPEALAHDLVELAAARPGRVRVLLDGWGSGQLADDLVPGLAALGRPPLRVHGEDFLRPAGERFEQGREDDEHFRTRWLDAGALEREVLVRSATGTHLPALWDAARDRSARRALEPVPERAVLLVDGLFLLGRGLTAELTVHVALSAGALRRRGVPEWQVPAFAAYDREVRPGDVADVLVRAEDPLRPAVLVRPSRL